MKKFILTTLILSSFLGGYSAKVIEERIEYQSLYEECTEVYNICEDASETLNCGMFHDSCLDGEISPSDFESLI